MLLGRIAREKRLKLQRVEDEEKFASRSSSCKLTAHQESEQHFNYRSFPPCHLCLASGTTVVVALSSASASHGLVRSPCQRMVRSCERNTNSFRNVFDTIERRRSDSKCGRGGPSGLKEPGIDSGASDFPQAMRSFVKLCGRKADGSAVPSFSGEHSQ